MFSYLWQIFFNISAVLTTIELWFINTEESQELAVSTMIKPRGPRLAAE